MFIVDELSVSIIEPNGNAFEFSTCMNIKNENETTKIKLENIWSLMKERIILYC